MKLRSVFLIHLIILVELKPTVTKKALRIGYSDNNNIKRNDFGNVLKFNYLNRLPFYLNKDTNNFFSKHGKHKKKPFIDLTREENTNFNLDPNNKFAVDYLDISDLQRVENKPQNIKEKPENLISKLTNAERLKILKVLQLSRRMVPLQKSKKRLLKFVISSSDSESSENSQLETEEDNLSSENELENKRTKNSPKRFQIIKNSAESSESDSDSDKLVYVQGPGRFVDADDDWRRRLPQFLPKRMHWNEEDYHSLRNYWINGPRGKYPR